MRTKKLSTLLVSISCLTIFGTSSFANEVKVEKIELILNPTNINSDSNLLIALKNKREIYLVILKSGSIIKGDILEKTYEKIKLDSNNFGIIDIPLDKILKIKKESEIDSSLDKFVEKEENIQKLENEIIMMKKKQKEIEKINELNQEIKQNEKKLTNLEKGKKADWFQNPNDTRLFFAPTAIPLKKGSGYFQNIDLFVLSANYGVTDNLSLGGFASLIPGFDVDNQVLAFTPKLGYELAPNFHLGGGLVYFRGAGVSQMGVLYGLGTYGNSDSNLTVALGGGYGGINKSGGILSTIRNNQENNSINKSTNAILGMVGGMHRVFENVALISENWIIGNTFSAPSSMFAYGFRFFNESVSFDLGVVYPLVPEVKTYPLPYIDIVFDF